MNAAGAIYGRVQDDGEKLRFPPEELSKWYRTLRVFKGKKVVISFEEDRETRSSRANRYYWGLVATPLAKSQEMTPEEFHDVMCQRFLPDERKRVEFFNEMTGESLTAEIDHRRSRKLNPQAFFDFVERVRDFGRTWLKVETEDPDPEWWSGMKR